MRTAPYALVLTIALLFFAACDRESQNDEYRRLYPISTELPEATCEGKNTIGCYVDSILFVANYFPNTSSWGSPTYDDGVRAFIENPDDDYIQIIAEHPIRPHEIDNRRMRLDIWYFPSQDSIGDISFSYVGNGFDFSISHNHIVPTPTPQYDFKFDETESRLCGNIIYAEIAEYNSQHLNDPEQIDTLILRDLRLDLPVYMGRY